MALEAVPNLEGNEPGALSAGRAVLIVVTQG